MNQSNLELVDTAFLLLSFAIKPWHFLDVHPIDKDVLNIDLTVEVREARICLLHGEIESYEVMMVASENIVSILLMAWQPRCGVLTEKSTGFSIR